MISNFPKRFFQATDTKDIKAGRKVQRTNTFYSVFLYLLHHHLLIYGNTFISVSQSLFPHGLVRYLMQEVILFYSVCNILGCMLLLLIYFR